MSVLVCIINSTETTYRGLSVCQSVCQLVYSYSLVVCLYVRLSVSQSVRLSVCLSVRPSVRLSVCLSVCIILTSHDQLPHGLVAQLVEQRRSIAEVMGSNPTGVKEFFSFSVWAHFLSRVFFYSTLTYYI